MKLDEIKKKQGEFLQAVRESHKFTQKHLGDLVGVTASTISMWESGASTPSKKNLEKLSDIFDISIEDILNGYKYFENNKDLLTNAENVAELLKKYSRDNKEQYFLTLCSSLTGSDLILLLQTSLFILNTKIDHN